VKDLLGHLQKQGPAAQGKKGSGGGKKKGKGKKDKAPVEEDEEDGDDDEDLSALLAQINGGGSGDED